MGWPRKGFFHATRLALVPPTSEDMFTDSAMPLQAASCDPAATERFVAAFRGSGLSELWTPLAAWLGLSGLMALAFLLATALQQAFSSTLEDSTLMAALGADIAGLHGLSAYFERDASVKNKKVMVVILVKVLAENLPQLFLQSAFFSASFSRFSGWGRLKILMSMGLGIISVLKKLSKLAIDMIFTVWRQPGEPRHEGLCILVAFILPGLGLVAWVLARIIMAHRCASHEWNLATGCAATFSQG